jgi:hypothetical protein
VPISNPAAVHGVQQAGEHSYEDFQVSADGEYAAFNSIMPLTDYPNAGQMEIFRFEADSHSLACASCAPTGSTPVTPIKLSPHGLNLTDDGRVFFTTVESFALRDTNGRQDAYEWVKGETQLISKGTGGEHSSLLSVSADGKNAFFFTRDKLVPEDENGSTVKLYTAREGGGYPLDPDPLPCAAADECHGAGTQSPGDPNINTQTGSQKETVTTPAAKRKCKKGKVKRKGKCVKRKKKKRRGNRAGGRR